MATGRARLLSAGARDATRAAAISFPDAREAYSEWVFRNEVGTWIVRRRCSRTPLIARRRGGMGTRLRS